MVRPAATQDSGREGPAYDGRGELSPACRVCGTCDAVARSMREFAPATPMNNETMGPATHAA